MADLTTTTSGIWVLQALLGVESMPTSFLIDRNGVVRHVQRGFRNGDVAPLREQIQELVISRAISGLRIE